MTMRLLLVLACCALAFSAFAAPAPSDVRAANETATVVPAHDIARGTVITADDLSLMNVPTLRMNGAFVREMADAVGKETRRGLRAGEIIRTSDLKRPTLVAKGSTVTMIFETTGMTLTTLGRALAEGGAGDVIAILNPTSYRKVEATVIAAGTVRVGVPRLPNAINGIAAAQR